MNKLMLMLITCFTLFFSHYAISNQVIDKRVATFTAVMASFDICKEKHPELAPPILDLQFPWIIMSSVILGKEDTGQMLQSYPNVVLMVRSNSKQWNKLTHKNCQNMITSSKNILDSWVQQSGHQKLPSWLNTEELNSIMTGLDTDKNLR